MRTPRMGDAMLGVVYLVLIGLFLLVAMAAYNKTFVSTTDIQLKTGTLGNALQKNSDVKLHGVPVGSVKKVETNEGGAMLTLSLEPSAAAKLPKGTQARLIPKTLFGERFVSLVLPESGSAGGMLKAGDTIEQDRSDEAVELEEVFDELLPMLQALQPEKLTVMLGEMAATLRGRGESLGDSLSLWNSYLTKLNPLVPTMTDDLQKLGDVALSYDVAAPDLLGALDELRTTGQTMVDQRTKLVDVYASVLASADTMTGWNIENQDTIEILSSESRRALEATAPYASQFPCLLESARKFIDPMNENLGKGTDEPGMHVVLKVVESRGKYLAGKDKPTYTTGKKPRCPYITGKVGTKPAKAQNGDKLAADDEQEPESISPPPTDRHTALAATGLGDANSPAENQLIAELLAPTQAMAPSEYPSWASLLVGPTLRNTKVTLS
jgi:phospholipid/cholesterol/gamma-HCH transport system substrate-binding protein